MADQQDIDVVEAPVAAAPVAAPAAKLTPEEALKIVLKNALVHDGLARGIHEAAKALDKRNAVLAVLATNCEEPAYGKLVKALCAEHDIKLVEIDDNKKLGEWVGLCKLDKDGNARKVVGCSCVVVKDFGEEGEALSTLLESLKK